LPSGENAGWVSQAGLSVSFFGGAEASTGARYRSKLVDHASSRPASRAVKTTPQLSGVNVNSSVPPNGLLGASASMPAIRSTGSPPAFGITNRWLRRPSVQVSQCRTNRRSQILPVTLLFSSSARRPAVSATVLSSGYTSRENSSRVPSGEMPRLATSSGSLVTGMASPPSRWIRHTCDDPERVDRKKMHFPQGDQTGLLSPASWVVRRRSPVPSVPTTQRSVRPRLASRSVVRSVKTTSLPSGETAGSEIRSMASMSWTENGCVSAAGVAPITPAPRAIDRARTSHPMRMRYSSMMW